MLLDAASDDISEPDGVRRLMRDLREVRMAKMRAGVSVLEGGREVRMNGVGGYVGCKHLPGPHIKERFSQRLPTI